MANYKDIASQFVTSYYQMFDTDRSQLGQFYGQEAKMSFEGDEKEGVVNIVAKLTSLKFQVVQHAGTAIDAQIIDGVGLLICVLGQLKVKCNFSNCVPVCHIFFRQMMIHLTPSHRLLY
jgi:hypothetical protein